MAYYLAYAAKLRAFRAKYPTYTAVQEAKRLEVLALLRAAYLGDDTERSRRDALVVEMRSDTTIPTLQRGEIAAYHDNLAVMRSPRLTRDQRLSGFERVVRNLIAEFPDVPTGYESLLAIAYSRSDDETETVAHEIQQMAQAPDLVKKRAQVLIYRYSLVGKPILDLVASAPDLHAALEREIGRPIVLFTWAAGSPGSVALASKLSAGLPVTVGLIGLNFDADIAAAKAKSVEEHLRGTQLFNAKSMGRVLTMQEPALIFLMDKQGVIASVSAQRDVAGLIEKLATP